METLLQKAASARQQYIEHFLASLTELRRIDATAVELLVKPNGRANPEPFCLCRVDAISGAPDSPKLYRFAADLDAAGWDLEESFDGMLLAVDSFSWESLVLTFGLPGFDLFQLGDWYARWLDVAEAQQPDDHGLSGVVHDLSWYSKEDGQWRLIVDLGSAPISALEELLHRLRDLGVDRCSVSRGDVDDV